MSVAISTALIIGGVAAAGAGVAGGVLSSKAANKAANTQANAVDSAAALQKQAADEALAFQKEQYATQQKQLAPWLSAGTTAINQLAGETVPAFQAPTAATEQNDPGYAFRLAEGKKILEGSAAARGNLLTGATGKAEEKYGEDYASNEYGNVYNRAMNDYNANVLGPYNRTAALAGIGQQAQASSAAQGQAATGNITNLIETSANQQATDVQNAAAARASGYVGSANAWNGALGGIGNNLLSTYLTSKLFAPAVYAPGN